MKRFIVITVFAVFAFAGCYNSLQAKIMSDENAIYNYEWFLSQEADIEKCVNAENIAAEAYNHYVETLEKPYSEKQEVRIASYYDSYIACQQITNKAISDYNARAQMVSRNIFKDNLPTNIVREVYTWVQLTFQ